MASLGLLTPHRRKIAKREIFVCCFVWQIRYEKKKNTVSEIRQNANAPLQFMDFCMNLLDNCCCLDTDSQKKIPFKASICEQRGWHYEKAALYFIWEMGFSLMWKYCLPHSKCRIPTNIALWIIQTKLHNYPFNMSNLVMILKNLLSDFSEGKCST